MNDLDTSIFSALFKEACKKCFGNEPDSPLSETESKLFASKIFDETGLVIGAKSIKNYSSFIMDKIPGREENPSVATMDTFARFVLHAPYTDEVQRKSKESHYPYWFQYKEQFHRSMRRPGRNGQIRTMSFAILTVLVIALLFLFLLKGKALEKKFSDDFNSVSDDSLSHRHWFLQSKNDAYWERRAEEPGRLTLFTLKGDNWPDSSNRPMIPNLLLRKTTADCFVTEIHLSQFFPRQNWQQAGLLLSEDTSFSGRALRLSLVYNDFSGGFPQSREIIIQAIVSNGKNSIKPEEIVHELIFKIDSTNEDLVRQNLRYSALRIEKHGSRFRLLFANGPLANSAFKELISQDIDINPRFIGLFAIRSFVEGANVIPAKFDYFSYEPVSCKK
jgi:hypothetical protein